MAPSLTSPPATLEIRRVAAHLGAEVTGVDLAGPLLDDVIAEIDAALLAHKVLFFRGQQLDHAAHLAFALRFGVPTRRPGTKHGVHPPGFPMILTIDPDAVDARYGRDFEEEYRQKWTGFTAGWHTDLTPAVNPPSAGILRAEMVPPFGGDTYWTSQVAAYEGMSPAMRALAEELRAEHAFFAGCQLSEADPRDAEILAMDRADPQIAIHPVVRVHPKTGQRALFLNPASVTRIVDVSPPESRRLLDLFFAQLTRPEYTVRFTWTAGTVAFWDNQVTAHLAATDLAHLPDLRRTMHRITLLGDRPVGPDGFTSQLVAGEPLHPYPATDPPAAAEGP